MIGAQVAETSGAVSPAKRAAETWTAANTKAGCETLVRRLRALQPERIAMEATGGYEQRVFRALREAGLPAVIVQPLNVREFARAMGKKATWPPWRPAGGTRSSGPSASASRPRASRSRSS